MPKLTITAVAREVGVSPSTLRYYERIGLLPTARRVAGRRCYDDYALDQVELITYAKRAGFSLAQIRAFGKAPPSASHQPRSGTISRSERQQSWIK